MDINFKYKYGETKKNQIGFEVTEILVINPNKIHKGIKDHFSEIVFDILKKENVESLLEKQGLKMADLVFTSSSKSSGENKILENVCFYIKSDLVSLLIKNENILISNGFKKA